MEIDEIKEYVHRIQGWLTDDEGKLLYDLAKNCSGKGVIVEIGSWKGKSTIWLSKGSQKGNKIKIYAIDPHTGHHIDPKYEVSSTFKEFKTNMRDAKVDDLIIPIIKTSEAAAKDFNKPVELIFVDGSHEYNLVKLDFELWFSKMVEGGIMAFHDSGIPFHHGPRKVVDELICKSENFRKVGFVDSITFGEKVGHNTLVDRLKNRYILLLMNRYELMDKSRSFLLRNLHDVGEKLRLPTQIRIVGKKLSKILMKHWTEKKAGLKRRNKERFAPS